MDTIGNFRLLTLTHRQLNLPDLAAFVIQESGNAVKVKLDRIKQYFGLDELMYLQTCNRVTFLMYGPNLFSRDDLTSFFRLVNPFITPQQIVLVQEKCLVLNGRPAVEHLFEVACSIDSLVIGEREILHQLRSAYDNCAKWQLTGDHIRMAIQAAVETAKEVFAKTRIGEKPLSVVSLAMHQIRKLNKNPDQRYLLIGAGQTMELVGKFLAKEKHGVVTVFNRTYSKAVALSESVGGKAYPLEAIHSYTGGFDILIVCTGSKKAIVDPSLYKQLLQGETGSKIVLDLAIPNNVDEQTVQQFPMSYIQIEDLREMAKLNYAFRAQEAQKVKELINKRIDHFDAIFEQRQIVRTINELPNRIKEVRNQAVELVFKEEIEALPPADRVVVEKLISYMEKRCISLPITMAKGLVDVPARRRR